MVLKASSIKIFKTVDFLDKHFTTFNSLYHVITEAIFLRGILLRNFLWSFLNLDWVVLEVLLLTMAFPGAGFL